MNGAIAVDKPQGMTSARVVACLKKWSRAAKVGHTGTLDPFATGVMICCFNQATRLARFLLGGNKKYAATMVLGRVTDTQDATGKVTAEKDWQGITEAAVREAFHAFTGEIRQQPPAFSALKHGGVPLYKLARQGKAVVKPPRPVTIWSIELLSMDLPEVRFTVHCSSGTYIRTLCHDIGGSLGCGGHLRDLRRTECCGFSIDRAMDLSELETLALSGKLFDKLVGMPELLKGMSAYTADAALVAKIRHGRSLDHQDVQARQVVPGADKGYAGFMKIVDAAGVLLAVMQTDADTQSFRYCCVFAPPG